MYLARFFGISDPSAVPVIRHHMGTELGIPGIKAAQCGRLPKLVPVVDPFKSIAMFNHRLPLLNARKIIPTPLPPSRQRNQNEFRCTTTTFAMKIGQNPAPYGLTIPVLC